MQLESLIDQLTIEERLEALELIWRKLAKDELVFQSPGWHEEVLNDRKSNPSKKPKLGLETALLEVNERLNESRSKR